MLDLQVSRELAKLSAIDKDLFRIALNNLINNAIKYNQSGGSVVLAADESDMDVVIAVRDSGIGMTPEDRERVTEKFFRVRETGAEQRGGHGLGLYLTNQIVELHHGRLTIDSEPGTRQRVLGPPEKNAGPGRRRPSPMNKRTILLVDDEPHVIRVLRLMLEREGYEVASANDGDEALAKMAHAAPT